MYCNHSNTCWYRVTEYLTIYDMYLVLATSSHMNRPKLYFSQVNVMINVFPTVIYIDTRGREKMLVNFSCLEVRVIIFSWKGLALERFRYVVSGISAGKENELTSNLCRFTLNRSSNF
jgi:hypothetical protein